MCMSVRALLLFSWLHSLELGLDLGNSLDRKQGESALVFPSNWGSGGKASSIRGWVLGAMSPTTGGKGSGGRAPVLKDFVIFLQTQPYFGPILVKIYAFKMWYRN